MEASKLQQFKNMLLSEKEKVTSLISELDESEIRNSYTEMSQELSFYDNHPADASSQLYEKEKALALVKNESAILSKIDNALDLIENGKYGICQRCGSEIHEERLSFIPYASLCVNCQKEFFEKDLKAAAFNNLNTDRTVKGSRYEYDDVYYYNHEYEDYIDSPFDRSEDEGYVEPIEKISNEQYKRQLPD